MGHAFFVLLFAAIIAPSISHAELIACNGVWTNRNCDSDVRTNIQRDRFASSESKVLRVPASPAVDAIDREAETEQDKNKRLAKERLLHDFRMRSIAAKRDYGVRLDLSAVGQLCEKFETTVADCQSEIARQDESLSSRVSDELRRRKLAKVDEPAKIETEQNNVAIVLPRRNRDCRYRDLRHGVCLDDDDNYPYIISGSSGSTRPVFTPGPFRRSSSTSNRERESYQRGSYGLRLNLR
jgi:hypothetical protein